ncbi:MAG TPA: ABC transporter ATP-binding protein, partial [Novosphingobium sp.]|nr:ABC transporter ATP-binding protein [Novosphingobium sp.]
HASGGRALPPGTGGLLGLFVLLVALRAALVQARLHAEQALQLAVTDNLRQRLLRTLFQADWLWLSAVRPGRLPGVLLGTIDRLGMGLQHLQSLFAAAVTLAIMLGAALLIDPLPAAALAFGGLLVLALHVALRRQARREGDRAIGGMEDYYGFYTERLALIRLIRIFGAEAREAGRAEAVAAALRRARLGFMRGVGIGNFALQAGTAAVLAATVWLAATRWHSSPATLLPLIAVSARAVPLLTVIQSGLQNLAHDRPAVAELGQCLFEASRHAELADAAEPVPQDWSELRLEQVALRHDGRASPALDGITLAIRRGSTVHVSGPSGAGKSSLADVIAALAWPSSGRMLLDGVPLAPGQRRAWRERVAYVQQEPVLLHASICDNLRWAVPDASDERIGRALGDAAAGFVLTLPEGLDTVVGERGTRLSGGERQRIALARGLLRDPALLILDEVTSALDEENQAAVAGAIAALKGRMTILIIGHGGSLVQLADRRLTLSGGCVISDTGEIPSQFVADGTGGAMEG